MVACTATVCLRGVLLVLEVLDSLIKRIVTVWGRAAGLSSAKQPKSKAGNKPPPPRTVGIILAEPDMSDVSVRTIARLTSW